MDHQEFSVCCFHDRLSVPRHVGVISSYCTYTGRLLQIPVSHWPFKLLHIFRKPLPTPPKGYESEALKHNWCNEQQHKPQYYHHQAARGTSNRITQRKDMAKNERKPSHSNRCVLCPGFACSLRFEPVEIYLTHTTGIWQVSLLSYFRCIWPPVKCASRKVAR
jgi:hypothetical protein